MKLRTKMLISLLAVIAVATMIFLFSAQQGIDSSKLSNGLTAWIMERVVPGYSELSAAKQRALLKEWGFRVRKVAHFSEYALLGMTLVMFLHYAVRRRGLWLILAMAWIAATLYAGTDEYHQMFVDGRGPALLDVVIDSAGALTGALLTVLALRLKSKRKAYEEARS